MDPGMEKQLRTLIQKARRTVADATMDPCNDWIKRELSQTKKLQDQIDRLAKSPGVTTQLFNEAREANDQLQGWIDKLTSFRDGKPVTVAIPDVHDSATFNNKIIKDADIYSEYQCPF